MTAHQTYIVVQTAGSGGNLAILIALSATVVSWVAAFLAWRTERTAKRTLEEASRQTEQAKKLYEHSSRLEIYARILDLLDEIRRRTTPTETADVLINFKNPEWLKKKMEEVAVEGKAIERRLRLLGSPPVAFDAINTVLEARKTFYAGIGGQTFTPDGYDNLVENFEAAFDKATNDLAIDLAERLH
jgi:hypothetical protein